MTRAPRVPSYLRSLTLGCIVLATALLTSPRPSAQEADDGDNSPSEVETKHEEQFIEEVVVTGRRWRRNRPEAPEWRVEPPKRPQRVRMSLGYDPVEARERALLENPAYALDPTNAMRPATIIRFRF